MNGGGPGGGGFFGLLRDSSPVLLGCLQDDTCAVEVVGALVELTRGDHGASKSKLQARQPLELLRRQICLESLSLLERVTGLWGCS